MYCSGGLAAALAAVIYVAHVGQAKADAGTGYELIGDHRRGARRARRSSAAAAAIPGTLLGLLAIAVLQNGLRLADLPPELAGILTGCCCWSRSASTGSAVPRASSLEGSCAGAQEEFTMKNSQLAVLCARDPARRR